MLSSSGAKGTFYAALSQSPPIGLPWFSRKLYSQQITPAVASAVGCTSTGSESDLVSCLQRVDANAFVTAAQTALPNISLALREYCGTQVAVEPFLPIVNGPNGTIDGQFNDLLSSGTLPNRVPFVVRTSPRDRADGADRHSPRWCASCKCLA